MVSQPTSSPRTLDSFIINADDFGMDAEVNRAVIDSFHQGLCSSTTLMANLSGFEDACQSCHDHKLVTRIGLHLNLGEGAPLTDGIRKQPRFCDADGRFSLSSAQRTWFMSDAEKHALADEIRAQIARCRGMRIPLTHVDSHRHLHVQWGILNVLLAVARQERVPYVRIPRNCGSGIRTMKAIYKRAVIRRIAAFKMQRTKHFGSIADYLWLRDAGGAHGSMEIMVHPRYLNSGVLADYPDNIPLAEQVQKVERYRTAIAFSEN